MPRTKTSDSKARSTSKKSVVKRGKGSASKKGTSTSKKTKSTKVFGLLSKPAPEVTPAKKATKVKRTPSKSQPRSSSKKGASKPRNFFTVKEDWTIIEFMKRNNEVKNTVIAKTMGKKLGRSSESIRDRIKKYLNKISDKDHAKIQKAAKKSPGHYVHYATDKAGGSRKTVLDITADEPGLKSSTTKKSASKKTTTLTKRVSISHP